MSSGSYWAAMSGACRSAGTAAYVIEIGQPWPASTSPGVELGRPRDVRALAFGPGGAVQAVRRRRWSSARARRVELDLVDAVAVPVVRPQDRRVFVGQPALLLCLV